MLGSLPSRSCSPPPSARELAGDAAEAEALRREALAGFRGTLGDEHPQTINAIEQLAIVLFQNGTRPLPPPSIRASRVFTEAAARCLTASFLATRHCAAPPPAGALEEVLKLSKEVLATRRRLLGDAADATRAALRRVSAAHTAMGNLRGSLDACREVVGPTGAEALDALGKLAGAVFERGDSASAEPLFRELATLRGEALGVGHVQTALASDSVAACCLLQGAARRQAVVSLSVSPFWCHKVLRRVP